MRITVCEMPDGAREFEAAWGDLREHVGARRSELVVLPEMPAHPWFAHEIGFDEAVWRRALEAHDAKLVGRLPGLAPGSVVLGSRPVEAGARLNQAFSWTDAAGYERVHEKHYLPDEDGYHEARWFDHGEDGFATKTLENGLTFGFLVCTEVMFPERARRYGVQGAHLVAVPRATSGHDRWLVAVRMAALVSGSFVASSNRVGPREDGGFVFGGRGWVVDPDGGVLAATSAEEPFVTVDVDPAAADEAKGSYPRNVRGWSEEVGPRPASRQRC